MAANSRCLHPRDAVFIFPEEINTTNIPSKMWNSLTYASFMLFTENIKIANRRRHKKEHKPMHKGLGIYGLISLIY